MTNRLGSAQGDSLVAIGYCDVRVNRQQAQATKVQKVCNAALQMLRSRLKGIEGSIDHSTLPNASREVPSAGQREVYLFDGVRRHEKLTPQRH